MKCGTLEPPQNALYSQVGDVKIERKRKKCRKIVIEQESKLMKKEKKRYFLRSKEDVHHFKR